jgi:hypothetical protein
VDSPIGRRPTPAGRDPRCNGAVVPLRESAMRRSLSSAVLSGLACCACAAPPDWRPVPDVPEVQLDVASLQLQGPVVSARLRQPAGARIALGLAAPGAAPAPNGHSTVVLGEFDCQARTVRTLGVLAYDSRGRLLESSSLPTRAQPLPRTEGLQMLYDAVCELARADAR